MGFNIFYKVRNFFTGDVVFMRAWNMRFRSFSVHNFNWGDDLNKYFFELASANKIVCVNVNVPETHYLCIGSTLAYYSLDNTIVYGAGCLTPMKPMTDKPKKIISVRGPLSRKILLQNGYKNWTDVIEEIAGSSFVMPESLHGVIVSEAYKVPCLWGEFNDHWKGTFRSNADWNFKFLDFYESIGKFGMRSFKLYEGYDFDELLKAKENWKPGQINYQDILDAFPFELKPEFRGLKH